MAQEPALRIPAPFIPIAQALSALSTEERERMQNALAVPHVHLHRGRLVDDLTKAIPGWDEERSSLLLDFVLSLHDLERLLDLDSPEAVANVLSQSQDLDLHTDTRKALAAALASILRTRAVSLMARARDLASEQEHVLDEARILTDVRALFAPDGEETLDGAIITHSLRLRYTGREGSALHISLDKSHLKQLAAQVARALRKAERLELLLANAALTYIEPEGSEDK